MRKIPQALQQIELSEEQLIERGQRVYKVFTENKVEKEDNGLMLEVGALSRGPSMVMRLELGDRVFDVGYLPSSHRWTLGETVKGRRSELRSGEGYAPDKERVVAMLEEVIALNPVEPVERLKKLVRRNRPVVQKFALFTVALMLLPLAAFFGTSRWAQAQLVEAPWVNIYPAVAAVVVANLVLFAYVVVAWTEDLSDVMPQHQKQE